jgi:hypothetical protein
MAARPTRTAGSYLSLFLCASGTSARTAQLGTRTSAPALASPRPGSCRTRRTDSAPALECWLILFSVFEIAPLIYPRVNLCRKYAQPSRIRALEQITKLVVLLLSLLYLQANAVYLIREVGLEDIPGSTAVLHLLPLGVSVRQQVHHGAAVEV